MRSLWRVGCVCLVAVGCGPDVKKVDTAVGECGFTLKAEYPENGAVNVYNRTTIDVEITGDAAGAAMVVTDAAGATVVGTVATNERHAYFVAAEPLSDGLVSVAWELPCGMVGAFSFTVVGGSSPVAAGAIVGRSYVLGLNTGNFIIPDGMGDALEVTLEYDLLIGVLAWDGGATFDMIGAVSTTLGDGEGVQQPCTPSIPFAEPAEFSANPYFSVHTDVLPIVVSGSTVEVADLTLTGTFAADGSSIDNATLSGIIDTRSLSVSGETGAPADPAEACNLFSDTYRIICEECSAPFDPGPYCLTLLACEYAMPESVVGELVLKTEASIAADGACDGV